MTEYEGFIPVKSRQKSHVKMMTLKPYNPTLSELIKIVTSKLQIYHSEIIGAFIYGSRARQTNHPNSDADIIVFWRHDLGIDFYKSVRESIEIALGFKIDFVSCVYMKKWIDHTSDRDIAYFDNVVIDAKTLIGTIPITFLIDQSAKLPKLPR